MKPITGAAPGWLVFTPHSRTRAPLVIENSCSRGRSAPGGSRATASRVPSGLTASPLTRHRSGISGIGSRRSRPPRWPGRAAACRAGSPTAGLAGRSRPARTCDLGAAATSENRVNGSGGRTVAAPCGSPWPVPEPTTARWVPGPAPRNTAAGRWERTGGSREARLVAAVQGQAAQHHRRHGQCRRSRGQRVRPAGGPAAALGGGQPQRRGAVRGDGIGDGLGGRPDAVFERGHGTSWTRRPSAASARDVVDFTVPGLTPIDRAISGSGRSEVEPQY